MLHSAFLASASSSMHKTFILSMVLSLKGEKSRADGDIPSGHHNAYYRINNPQT
jgi:hypothetical protein